MTRSPQSHTQIAPDSSSESGYILVAVLFLVALILLSLAIAAPKISQSIQRDKELELVHRGEQYKHAIKLYYRKFGSYPASIDQLENTNQIRFLRKRYTDPMTGKDDWKIIHYGQAHIPIMGLFGQPMGTTPAGSGAAGSVGTGMVPGVGGTSGTAPGTSISGNSTTNNSTTTPGTGSSTPSLFDSTDSSSTGSGTTGTTGGLSTTGTPGTGTGTGMGTDGNPVLGGGPIVGIAIPSTKASIKEYKKQKHYNEWEFVYDPLEDQLQAGTLFGGAAQNPNGTSTNGTGGLGGIGGGIGTSGTGTNTTPTGGTGTSSPTQQQ
jgi:type II secretory pathway pseudopilin PulG